MEPQGSFDSGVVSSTSSSSSSSNSTLPSSMPPTSTTTNSSSGLFNLVEIQSELQRLVTQSAQSKAKYRAKLGGLTTKVSEANANVQELQDQLQTAQAKLTKAQQVMDQLKVRREYESKHIQVRKLQLQIQARCLVDAAPELLEELEEAMLTTTAASQSSSSSPLQGVDNNNNNTAIQGKLQLLDLQHQRLQQIKDLMEEADTWKVSKQNVHKREQGKLMKQEAIQTYILLHKYQHL